VGGWLSKTPDSHCKFVPGLANGLANKNQLGAGLPKRVLQCTPTGLANGLANKNSLSMGASN